MSLVIGHTLNTCFGTLKYILKIKSSINSMTTMTTMT